MALYATASAGSRFRSPDLLAIVSDVTIVNNPYPYPVTIILFILKSSYCIVAGSNLKCQDNCARIF